MPDALLFVIYYLLNSIYYLTFVNHSKEKD